MVDTNQKTNVRTTSNTQLNIRQRRIPLSSHKFLDASRRCPVREVFDFWEYRGDVGYGGSGGLLGLGRGGSTDYSECCQCISLSTDDPSPSRVLVRLENSSLDDSS